MQIGEFMHRYTFNTLPDAFDDYFNRTSVFHSYHTRNSTQYRSVSAHTNTRIFAIKSAGHPFGIVSLKIFTESQVDL